MACCGQASPNFEHVWQLRLGGDVVIEHTDQAVVLAEKAKRGGGGVVLKATKRKAASN